MMEEGEEGGEGVVLASETRLTRNQRRLAGNTRVKEEHKGLQRSFAIQAQLKSKAETNDEEVINVTVITTSITTTTTPSPSPSQSLPRPALQRFSLKYSFAHANIALRFYYTIDTLHQYHFPNFIPLQNLPLLLRCPLFKNEKTSRLCVTFGLKSRQT
jgi:hypothetical protein